MRRLGLSLAVIVFAALLFWAWRALDVEQAGPVSRAPAEPSVAAERSEVDLTAASPHEVDRQSAPVAAVELPANAPRPQDATARVLGRCVDENAAPLAGTDVHLVRYTCGIEVGSTEWIGSKPTTWIGSQGPPVARATSDALGRFTIGVDCVAPARVFVVVVAARSPGRAPCVRHVEVEEGRTEIEFGDFVLPRSVTLAGSVRDVQGFAVADAVVLVLGKDRKDSGSTAKSRADGTFRIEDAPPGAISLYARLEDRRTSSFASHDVAPGERVDGIELVVPLYEDPNAISGIVLGVDGLPLPGATVSGEYEVEEGTVYFVSNTADEHARFRIGPRTKSKFSLRASHPRDEATPAVLDDVVSGQHGLVMRLTPLRTCVVRVRDETGAPITRFGVRTQTQTTNQHRFGKMDAESDRPEGQATVTLEGVPFRIELSATGFETALVGPFDPATVGPLVEATLKRLPALRGFVTARGQPVGGAVVEALEALGPMQRGNVDSFAVLTAPCQDCPQTKSDADGRFTIPLTKSGRWHARARHASHPSLLTDAIDVRSGVDVPELNLDVGPRGAIEGRMRHENGDAVVDAIVGASCGDDLVLVATPDSDGRFRFEPLRPGSWQVRALPKNWKLASADRSMSEYVRKLPEIEWDCSVTDGGVTTFDLIVPSPATLDVELTPQLASLGAWSVTVWKQGKTFPAAAPDAAGVMRVTVPASGRWWVNAQHGPEDANILLQEEVDLPPGQSRHVVRLVAGRLRGKVRTHGSETVGVFLTATAGATKVRARASIAADGSFTFPVAPAGEVELRLDEVRKTPATRVTVVAGQDNDAGEI